MCGDFNFFSSYSIVETNYSMMFGMIGLLIISVFGGSVLMWLICPTPSLICLPCYLRILNFICIIFRWLAWLLDGQFCF
jgi:NADH-ubiquinone oxidoreductase chain 5